MEVVDKAEVERLKAFLGLGEFYMQTLVKQASERQSHHEGDSIGRYSSLAGSQKEEPGQATITNAMDLREEAMATKDDVDWQKVGKVYNKNTQLNEVFDRELGRLNKALDAKLVLQDE